MLLSAHRQTTESAHLPPSIKSHALAYLRALFPFPFFLLQVEILSRNENAFFNTHHKSHFRFRTYNTKETFQNGWRLWMLRLCLLQLRLKLYVLSPPRA